MLPPLILVVLCVPTLVFSDVVDDSETFPFSQQFSPSVRPCVDLNEFVCNGGNNTAPDLFETQREVSMKELIEEFFLTSGDPILLQFRDVIETPSEEEDLFAVGAGFGRNAALGRVQTPEVILTKEWNNILIKFEAPQLTVTYKRFDSTDPLYNTKPRNASQHEFVRQMQTSKVPYFYMLWAREMLESGKFPQKLITELREIFENIRNEIISVVEECAWLEAGDKQRIVSYLEGGFGTVLGIPDIFYDKAMLNEAIEYVQDEFPKIVERLESQSCYYDLGASTCVGDCRLQLFNEALTLADKEFREYYREFDDGLDKLNRKTSLLAYNAYNKFTHTIFLPAYIHIYKNSYPRGFVYGSIGVTFAHELFHSLGLRRQAFREFFTHHSREEFRNATHCYDSYYDSFPFKLENGTTLSPDGAFKSEEGFADVEGARVAFRALAKVARGPSKSRRSLSRRLRFDKFDDFEWFFVGLASKFCVSSDSYDEEKELAQFNDSHPRETVRANAIARQMREFPETFHCNAEDPMYTVEDVCYLYPPA